MTLKRTAGEPPISFGVIFDMDGVLVDSADAHWKSWRILGERECRPIREESFAQTFGRQNKDIIPIFFGDVSPLESQRLADQKEEIYRDLVRARPPIVEGATELVRGLRRIGAALAIGSSGPRENIMLIVSAMGIGDSLDAIVCAEDVTRGKPDPQVFAVAAERLTLPSDRCVVVEDAPAGVTAAKRAGAKCAAVLMHHDREALAEADLIVDRLDTLTPERLAQLALR